MNGLSSGERPELAYWIALQRISGVGPVTYAKLLEQYGSPRQILSQPNQIKSVSASIQQALSQPDWQQVEEDLEWAEQPDRFILTIDDPKYPALLKEIADPPCVLYVQGDLNLLSSWQLAIVGSRNPSRSGEAMAYEFAEFFAANGIAVNSGLALGIDAAAHKGALAAQGKTVAVVATGLDRVYPAKNKALAHQIVETGAIVSEFPLGTSPRAELFPRRNRIISGLSLGTLVVEAAPKSGSLITARMAMEQGREVFAIPGSIHNPLAKGCHQLIKQGAKLVECAEDVVEELGALANFTVEQSDVETKQESALEKDHEYQVLFEYLGYDPISIDSVIENSGLTADAVSSMLLILELEGQVESLPGGRYVRSHS